MTQKEVTRAIIYTPEGKILLAKRAGGQGKDQWALIGGKPEGDEKPHETVIREVLEETGLTFFPTLFKEETDEVDGISWRVSYFSGNAEGEITLAAYDNSEAKYFGPDELGTITIAFGHDRILKEFLDSLAE